MPLNLRRVGGAFSVIGRPRFCRFQVGTHFLNICRQRVPLCPCLPKCLKVGLALFSRSFLVPSFLCARAFADVSAPRRVLPAAFRSALDWFFRFLVRHCLSRLLRTLWNPLLVIVSTTLDDVKSGRAASAGALPAAGTR